MSVHKFKNALLEGPGPQTKKEAIVLFIKAFFMGMADLIPGVSGGTIAFITGIYEKLLDAIGSIDKDVIKDLLTLNFTRAISKVHTRFILVLAPGVLFAIFTLARLMHFMMTNYKVYTWSLFFGLIGASTLILAKEVDDPLKPKNIFMVILGAIFSYTVVGLIPVSTPETLPFIFICGMISIMAMILPGISGSFLLLMLGKYEFITGAIKNPFSSEALAIIVVFSLGAALGLGGFSRVINYGLKKYHSITMSFLTGVLIGSLRKMWPWKEVLETKIVRGKIKILREQNLFPTNIDQEVYIAVFLCILGVLLIVTMEKSRKKIEGK